MKRSDILMHCLINSGCRLSEREIKQAINQTFVDTYPKDNYKFWDIDISDDTANHIIKTVGRASFIRVDLFIRDLWDAY